MLQQTHLKPREHQENKRSGAVEDWEGYYFARRRYIVIVLRGSKHLDNLPKFYLFPPPHLNENGVMMEAAGMMLKIGSGGFGGSGGIFLAHVKLRRDDDAFAKCDVVPNRDVDDNLLDEIPAIPP